MHATKCFEDFFLKSDTIGIIPRGGYTDGRIQSKQAMMRLAYLQMTECIRISHGHNGTNTDCPNYHIILLMITVKEKRQYVNLWAVFRTVTHVFRLEIDLLVAQEKHWWIDKKEQLHILIS